MKGSRCAADAPAQSCGRLSSGKILPYAEARQRPELQPVCRAVSASLDRRRRRATRAVYMRTNFAAVAIQSIAVMASIRRRFAAPALHSAHRSAVVTPATTRA